jgi:hypothetical protein
VLDEILDYRALLNREWLSLSTALKHADPNIVPIVFTRQHYLWARAVLDTRSIWWEGQRHQVPLLDMCNCESNGQAWRKHETELDEAGDAVGCVGG